MYVHTESPFFTAKLRDFIIKLFFCIVIISLDGVFLQLTAPQAAAVRTLDQTYYTGYSSTSCSWISRSFSDSGAPWVQGVWEYKDWNAPVSLILSLSPCRCPTASRLNQISPSSHSFRVVGRGLSVARLMHWLFLSPLFTLRLWISTCIPQQQMTYHIPLKLLSGS